MTRRERHLRILDSFGQQRVWREFQQTSASRLIEMLSDDGVEKITRQIVQSYKLQQKFNAENRRIAAMERA